ncbi:methyltransferase [Actinokineospora soli]|uniref:Methyltransferase n=1 Tax=Actinokineospora soli TaxID=1048753 RepID=A0ABW2TT88_9PSEU
MALTASRAGARTVTAVDITRRAVLTARLNTWLHRARITVHHGDALTVAAGTRYDIVLANPPYVPTLDDSTPTAPPTPGTAAPTAAPTSTASAPRPPTSSPPAAPS